MIARDFRWWVRWLRRHFPAHYPVRVMHVKPSQLAKQYGRCEVEYNGKQIKRFTIRVVDNLPAVAERDTIWEEWAHCLRMHLLHVGDVEGHDQIYGAIFNAIKQSWDDRTQPDQQGR